VVGRRDFAAAKNIGCFHGVELPYIFHYFPAMLRFNAEDEKLSGGMMGYWSRFARTGDPNDGGAPIWRPYGPATPYVQPIN
jgi:para-nitrobenzyl esterase